MAEAPSKKRWNAEFTTVFSVRLMKKTDQDVIDFLEGKNKRDILLKAFREYMKNHPDE